MNKESGGDLGRDEQSTGRARTIVSVLIASHFLALILALSANLSASFLQGELMRWSAPYLTTTHQAYGLMPLEFTHANPMDFPLQVQVKTARGWQVLDGFGKTNETQNSVRSWTNLARILTFISEEEPDAEILSEVGLRFVRQADTHMDDDVTGLRFIQPSVLDFDEDSMLNEDPDLPIDNDPVLVFEAVVVREDGKAIGMVPVQEESRTSRARVVRQLHGEPRIP